MYILKPTWLRKHPTYSIYYVLVSERYHQQNYLDRHNHHDGHNHHHHHNYHDHHNHLHNNFDDHLHLRKYIHDDVFILDWKLLGDELGPNGPYHNNQLSHLQKDTQVMIRRMMMMPMRKMVNKRKFVTIVLITAINFLISKKIQK